jgi:hypothetical protein
MRKNSDVLKLTRSLQSNVQKFTVGGFDLLNLNIPFELYENRH